MSIHSDGSDIDPSEPPYEFKNFRCPNCQWQMDFHGEWEEGGVIPSSPVYEFFCDNCKSYVTFEPVKEEKKDGTTQPEPDD